MVVARAGRDVTFGRLQLDDFQFLQQLRHIAGTEDVRKFDVVVDPEEHPSRRNELFNSMNFLDLAPVERDVGAGDQVIGPAPSRRCTADQEFNLPAQPLFPGEGPGTVNGRGRRVHRDNIPPLTGQPHSIGAFATTDIERRTRGNAAHLPY